MNLISIFALFTLIFLGFSAGVVLCLLSVAGYFLHRAAILALDHTQNAEKNLIAISSRNSLAIEKLETSLFAALSKLDAHEMREASFLIQRTQRQFARTTDQFMKLLYSQEGAAQIAAEEARESAEAAQDQAYSGIDPQAYVNHLKQRDAEKKLEESRGTTLHKPPLDPDQAWTIQDEEELAGGPLA